MAFDKNRVLRFKTRHVPSKSGEKLVDEFKLTYNDDGTQEVIVCGKRDIYAEIQSHADSVDIHKIIEMCIVTGNEEPLYKTKGFYGDLVGMPKTYAEALQKAAEAEHLWSQLPTDVKEKFDNSVEKFFATAFSKEWIEKIGIKEDEPKIESEGDVNE